MERMKCWHDPFVESSRFSPIAALVLNLLATTVAGQAIRVHDVAPDSAPPEVFKSLNDARRAGCIPMPENSGLCARAAGNSGSRKFEIQLYEKEKQGYRLRKDRYCFSSWYFMGRVEWRRNPNGPAFLVVHTEGNTGTGELQILEIWLYPVKGLLKLALFETSDYRIITPGRELHLKGAARLITSKEPLSLVWRTSYRNRDYSEGYDITLSGLSESRFVWDESKGRFKEIVSMTAKSDDPFYANLLKVRDFIIVHPPALNCATGGLTIKWLQGSGVMDIEVSR